MGAKSTVGTLPDDILEPLHILLQDPRVTLNETTAIINAVIAAQAAGDQWLDAAIADIRRIMAENGVANSVAGQCIGLILDWVTGKPRKIKAVSRSAVGRYSIDYAQEFSEFAKEIRDAKLMVEPVMDMLKLNNQSDIAQVTRELLQLLLLRLIPMAKRTMQGVDMGIKDIKALTDMIKNMTQSQQQLEQTASIRQKRDTEIRREAAKEATERAAQAVEKAAIGRGLTQEFADFLRGEVLQGGV